jgi:hypothetical protein
MHGAWPSILLLKDWLLHITASMALRLAEQQHKIMSKRLDRMQNKIEAASEVVGMAVD